MTSSQSKTESVIKILIISLFFLFVFSSYMKPLTDPDTSWHVKTGEYIYVNKTIPQEDPFSYAEDEIQFVGKFILSQYWFAQVFYHLIYSSYGTLGLVLLGAATLTGIIALLWSLLKEKGFYVSMLLAGGFAFLILLDFTGIRPQMFTFLFAAITIFLLEKYKEQKSGKYLAWLPLIMLVWANIHGGFIYGVVVMLIYLFSEYMTLFLKNKSITLPSEPLSKKQIQYFSIICIVSIAISLINPNTYKAFLYAFTTHNKDLFSRIAEYQSPIGLWNMGTSTILMSRYWIYTFIMVILLIIFVKRRDITPVLLILFATSLTFMSIRYIPLFAIVATAVFRYIPFKPTKSMSGKAEYAAKIITALVLGGLLFYSHPFKGYGYYQYSNSHHYAVSAANFLKKNNITGNIIASYNKSSFLLLQLFPDSRIYADSRWISEARYTKGLRLEGEFDSATTRLAEINKLIPKGIGTITVNKGAQDNDILTGREQWRNMLEEMKAEIIVYEGMNMFSGNIYTIILRLIQEDDWKLIYADGNAMIFIKDIEKYKEIINKFNKSKKVVFDQIIVEGLRGIEKDVQGFYTNTALALLLKGVATDQTLYYIETALSNDPNDILANYCKTLYTLMIQKQKSE